MTKELKNEYRYFVSSFFIRNGSPKTLIRLRFFSSSCYCRLSSSEKKAHNLPNGD